MIDWVKSGVIATLAVGVSLGISSMLGGRSRSLSGLGAFGGRYTAAELRRRRTLSVAQADDLKIDTGKMRVWLARTGVEDGEPYDDKVTIEKLRHGRWEVVEEYPG